MALIDDKDLLIESYSQRALGGQHVGTDSGVRVEHIPSGLVAIVTRDRSQHRNRQIAIEMLEGGLTSPYFR